MSDETEVWFRYRRWGLFSAVPWLWPCHWKGRLLYFGGLLTALGSMALVAVVFGPRFGPLVILAGVLASVPFIWVGKRHAQFYEGLSPLEEMRASFRRKKDD